MSIDFEEAWARSREGHTFSNNTEWEIWSANWCDVCQRDAPFRNGISRTGCPLILIALSGRVPAEWMEQPWIDHQPPADLYHCIEFRPPGGGGGEPRPKPEPPDMDGLFPRPERRTRMFVQPPPHTVRYRRTETRQTTGGVL